MNQNPKLYYILPAIVLIIIIVVALLLPKKNTSNQTSPTPTSTQMPTLIPSYGILRTASSSSSSQGKPGAASPTLIPPNYTGVIEEQHIPQAETDLAVQKSELRKKLPLTQPAFTITFDYANDQFTVTLNEPKETSKTQFNQWLQINYPNIPVDRFAFK